MGKRQERKGRSDITKGSPYRGDMSKKRKVSPKKPSVQKKSRANKPQSHNVLTMDDIELIIKTIEDSLEDILQRHGAKQDSMYERIDKELKEIQQDIHLTRTVSTAPSSTKTIEFGDEPTQLHRLSYFSSPRRKGAVHIGLEERKGGGPRATSGCTARER
jgi:hypothetical protein